MSRAQAESLREAFAEFSPRIREGALADFSGLRSGAPVYCEVAPRTADAAARIVRAASVRGIALRTRAQGHSLNGASLPGGDELLLSTRHVRQVRFEAPGSVTAGCGVVLWILQHFLRRRGFDLPVLNDGYPGPTVGGYIAAGGFGPRSARYGGFWDNVLELRLVDGRGEIHRITRHDGRFPWLFGSMGQLGVLLDARLAIVPAGGPAAASAYPQGEHFVAPQLAQPKVPAEFTAQGDESLFWFTLFVPDERIDDAHAGLTQLERHHRGALRFQERYRYPIRYGGRMAPLVYPYARSFTATGAWGWLTDASEGGVARLLEFDRDFMSLAQSSPDYRRYVQSELARGAEVYERCFGAALYAELGRLKAELDPAGLFNRGSVFPAR